jgi:hypothetical protein
MSADLHTQDEQFHESLALFMGVNTFFHFTVFHDTAHTFWNNIGTKRSLCFVTAKNKRKDSYSDVEGFCLRMNISGCESPSPGGFTVEFARRNFSGSNPSILT